MDLDLALQQQQIFEEADDDALPVADTEEALALDRSREVLIQDEFDSSDMMVPEQDTVNQLQELLPDQDSRQSDSVLR